MWIKLKVSKFLERIKIIIRFKDYWIIRKSGLFDPTYYLITYADIRKAEMDPLMHFVKYGWKEGRNPSASFDTTFYLASNTDVCQAKINPLVQLYPIRQK